MYFGSGAFSKYDTGYQMSKKCRGNACAQILIKTNVSDEEKTEEFEEDSEDKYQRQLLLMKNFT